MQFPTLALLLTLASAASAAPSPAAAPQDFGICINYSYNAQDVVKSCLTTKPYDFKTCHTRVADCIRKVCGLSATSTQAQTDACVKKLLKSIEMPDSPVVKCVRGFVGGCPSYTWE